MNDPCRNLSQALQYFKVSNKQLILTACGRFLTRPRQRDQQLSDDVTRGDVIWRPYTVSDKRERCQGKRSLFDSKCVPGE